MTSLEETPIPEAANGAALGGARHATETAPWPKPLAPEAFYGLAGNIVRAIEPHTEADPAALLVQCLACYGNAIGMGPHFLADGSRHAFKLFVAIVGDTAKGRKGTSWARVEEVFRLAAPTWAKQCVLSGLASGEGLIWQVRDPAFKRETDKKTGETNEIEVDPGVADKRLLVIEPELASTMTVMGRHGNTLSAIIRDAWDKSALRTLTKNSPAQSTGAHVSIVGHVTGEELRRSLDRTELGNGFANRFVWICARRARVLPFGGERVEIEAHVQRLVDAIDFARQAGEVTWAADARPVWAEKYEHLSEGRPGILGAVTARAEAQVVRIASLYALLDKQTKISAEHLWSALALWGYAAESAAWVWGNALGDPVADELLRLLRGHPDGMTRTDIRDAFGRHKSGDVDRALAALEGRRLARQETQPTGGRPVSRWFAT
jgi:hypothetical protein